MMSVIHGLSSFLIILSVLILIESCPKLSEGLSLEMICKVLSLLIKMNLKIVFCGLLRYVLYNG